MSTEPIHYRPYADEPAACGNEDGVATIHADRTTCPDCEYAIR